jgi:hypothetical protein
MKWKIFIAALVVSASLCGQSFGSTLFDPCGTPACAPCNKCCKPLFSGLADYMNCRFPCGPALVIKPISLHRRCH